MIVAQAIDETKSTDAVKLVEYLEKGASFDILKARRGMFRAWDHQLLQEMYVVKVKDKAKMKDKWDIFEIVRPVPGPTDSLDPIPRFFGSRHRPRNLEHVPLVLLLPLPLHLHRH